jgi:hypothetical protein
MFKAVGVVHGEGETVLGFFEELEVAENVAHESSRDFDSTFVEESE